MHTASAFTSADAVDDATVHCSLELYDRRSLLMYSIKPDVDLRVSGSAPKSESTYSSRWIAPVLICHPLITSP